MARIRQIALRSFLLALVFALPACADDATTEANTEGGGGGGGSDEEFAPPVSDLGSLFADAPSNDELPAEGKDGAIYPAEFDLVELQSPVRSQARRGTCSIFSTVGLMEHLYIKEGTLPNPDFSEQFLQWSAKIEAGRFPNTGGSSASSNLEAIHRFGIVTEEVWPYDTSGWDEDDDERCTGDDDQPTICYTNGDPTDEMLEARRWDLPRGRWIRSSVNSIKAYMTSNETAVIAGLTFYYQAWNHGGSSLPTDREGVSQGWIRFPNDEDIADSEERPAGHSILLVGWNDDLEVPVIDGSGNRVFDDNGDPVVETGFFLFKNSWGTGSFGTQNPFGPGYGWVSYRYVEEYGTIYSSTVPTVELDAEVCDDGNDNDLDGDTDCDDDDCANDNACNDSVITFSSDERVDIPDNDETGASSSIEVAASGTVDSVTVRVDIEHTYRGDLTVSVTAPGGEPVVLQEKQGGSEDDLVASFSPDALIGSALGGTWTLTVVDSAGQDTGAIRGWAIEVTASGSTTTEVCDDGTDNDANGQADCADSACLEDAACADAETVSVSSDEVVEIPDNDADGISSLLEVTEEGTIDSIYVDVNITHPYRGDLVVTLVHDSGRSVVLHDRDGGGSDNIVRRFEADAFVGEEANGIYSLDVSDNGNLDTGRLESWGLEMTIR